MKIGPANTRTADTNENVRRFGQLGISYSFLADLLVVGKFLVIRSQYLGSHVVLRLPSELCARHRRGASAFSVPADLLLQCKRAYPSASTANPVLV